MSAHNFYVINCSAPKDVFSTCRLHKFIKLVDPFRFDRRNAGINLGTWLLDTCHPLLLIFLFYSSNFFLFILSYSHFFSFVLFLPLLLISYHSPYFSFVPLVIILILVLLVLLFLLLLLRFLFIHHHLNCHRFPRFGIDWKILLSDHKLNDGSIKE